MVPIARLRKPIERHLRAGHPWIWRDALEPMEHPPGRITTVLDRRGRFLARGYADAGAIGIRVLTYVDEPIDGSFVGLRLRRAAELRARVISDDTDAYRVLHGEGDGLPGVVIDRYADHAVLQPDGSGAAAFIDAHRAVVEDFLRERGVTSLLLRTGRRETRTVTALFGDLPSASVGVREHGVLLRADLVQGQKTGLFLDQRESRRRVRTLSGSLRVLNLYGYTGGFSIAAALGGARHVTTVDVAASAIELAKLAFEDNGIDPSRHDAVVSDVHAFLDREHAERKLYDMVVCDPPSFAPRESARDKALASYRQLHQSAFKLLAPGGLYVAASCSSHIDSDDFVTTITDAAPSTQRVLQVLDRWGAPPDHPRRIGFPEGDYLKVVLVRVID